ncbi:MAG: hypothetical protein AVDCRST_MAG01-01-2586, partial [uncultured Rubrobacteraceae bacterium]
GSREARDLEVRPPLPHRGRGGGGRQQQARQVPGVRGLRPPAGGRRAGDAGAEGGGPGRAE